MDSDFQTDYAAWAGKPGHPYTLMDAQDRIARRATGTAIGLFKSWDIRCAEQEGEDAAQDWNIELRRKVYPAYSPLFPIYPLAHVALVRICMRMSWRARKYCPLPETFELPSRERSPLEELIWREIYELYAWGKSRLSERCRDALDSKRDRPRRRADQWPAGSDPRRDYNALHRAVKRLKNLFERYRRLDD